MWKVLTYSQQLWSGSFIYLQWTELIQNIALKLVHEPKPVECVWLGCWSMWLWIYAVNACLRDFKDCMCVCLSTCPIELVFIICCYMKTVLYLIRDPSVITILHRKSFMDYTKMLDRLLERRSKMHVSIFSGLLNLKVRSRRGVRVLFFLLRSCILRLRGLSMLVCILLYKGKV